MKQVSLNRNLLSKKTRKQTFLGEMEKVVPWADLEALIAPYYCEGFKGRPPFALQTMLRTHFMQQWFKSQTLVSKAGLVQVKVLLRPMYLT